jgi:hypothetical protein
MENVGASAADVFIVVIAHKRKNKKEIGTSQMVTCMVVWFYWERVNEIKFSRFLERPPCKYTSKCKV